MHHMPSDGFIQSLSNDALIMAILRKGSSMLLRFLSSMLVIHMTASLVSAASGVKPYHLDRNLLPNGCASCHVGFDFSNGGGSYKCLSCHGPLNKRPKQMVMRNIQTKDVSKDFAKNYRHPVFDGKDVHSSREILPETSSTTPRHAVCVDCHNPHYISSENVYAGVRGKRVGNFSSTITKEYELCYLCHGDSANLPVRSTNKRAEFSTNNPSFHPVEGEGRNLQVVSLLRPYREKKEAANDISVIKCADCHGSDDPNSSYGPHGSKYRGLLVDNYETGDKLPESSFNYALCYRCHKRSSILGNESFPFHSRHITGEPNSKEGGTSCYTCHSSHGSTENRYLIRFNRDYVTESSSGKRQFVEKGAYSFHGDCYLTCHGVDHNPKSY